MTLKEPLGVWGDKNFTSKGILDLLNVTKYQSDYLRHLIRYFKLITEVRIRLNSDYYLNLEPLDNRTIQFHIKF